MLKRMRHCLNYSGLLLWINKLTIKLLSLVAAAVVNNWGCLKSSQTGKETKE